MHFEKISKAIFLFDFFCFLINSYITNFLKIFVEQLIINGDYLVAVFNRFCLFFFYQSNIYLASTSQSEKQLFRIQKVII